MRLHGVACVVWCGTTGVWGDSRYKPPRRDVRHTRQGYRGLVFDGGFGVVFDDQSSGLRRIFADDYWLNFAATGRSSTPLPPGTVALTAAMTAAMTAALTAALTVVPSG